MNFTKPPLSIADQISKLKKRGLIFYNETKAAHYLSNISYYRLRAYTYPFQDNTDPDHPFVKVVSFEEIIDLYVFDRKLRLLIFNAIEKIEVAFRTKIVYEFSMVHGSHWYEDSNMYRDTFHFNKNINTVYEEIERSTETFIQHYKDTYSSPLNPPAWMNLEVVSMGLLSKLFANLKKGPEKKKVSREFGIAQPEILESWMHALANLRNTCAHHSRVWNRRFSICPQMPYNTLHTFLNNRNIYPNKLYAQLWIPHVDGNALKNYLLLLPPLSEQEKIANFLDYKTSKIGRLTPELTISKLKTDHCSYPTNPRLAEPLYQAAYIERFGTGTGEIFRLTKLAGLKPPEINLEEGFKITIWRPSVSATGQVTGQATGQVTGQVTEAVRRVLLVTEGEMKSSEIIDALDLRHRESFRDNYLTPAIEEGCIEMTIPDKPNSPKQKYRLTPKGIEIKKKLGNKKPKT
jgi:abortive infection bacteriophage resistance protein